MRKAIVLSLLRPGDVVFTRENSIGSIAIRIATLGCYSHAAIVIYPDIWYETDGHGAGFRYFDKLKECQINGSSHIITESRKGSMSVLRNNNVSVCPKILLKAIEPNIALKYPHIIYFLPLIRLIGKTKLVKIIIAKHQRKSEESQTSYCSQLVFRIIHSIYGINQPRGDDHISPQRLYSTLKKCGFEKVHLKSTGMKKIEELGVKNTNLNVVKNHLSYFQRPHDKKAWREAMVGLAKRNNLCKHSLLSKNVDASVLQGIQKSLTNPRHFRVHDIFWENRYR